MVKLLLFLSLLYLISNGAHATSWNNLSPGQTYKLKSQIEVKNLNLKLGAGESLTLLERADLNMIKVKLFKYKMKNRKSQTSDSAIELVPVKQNNEPNVSVGVTLAKDCILEVFVQEQDSKSETFFI